MLQPTPLINPIMLDDEVEYLGTRPARPPSVSDPLTHHRPVTGITIHVEKSGSVPAYDLSFHEADSRVVQIGRRPGTDIDKCDPGKAMFRCPVVSRKHAKITFTDAGSVYLFDLQSHHGTHVRKPDETMSTPLLPETPYLLGGGEIITLGKSVGKGEDLVRPVVFTIEIQYQSNPSAQLIDLTRSASSERQVSPPIKICPLKSSGRYGLNDSSSDPSSDEMSCSYTSENTSDIEEISSTSSHEKGKCSPVPNSSHIGHAIEVLRSLIPPLHPPSMPSQRSQSSTGDQSPLLVFPPMHLPALNSCYHHHRYFPTSPPFDLPPLSIALCEKTPEIFDWEKPYGRDASGPLSDKSRSTSPMDLGSPSPAPASEKETYPPLSISGWPIRAVSPVPSISSLYVECGLDSTTAALSCATEEQSAPAEQEVEPISISNPRSSGHLTQEDQANDSQTTQTRMANVMEVELGDLNGSIEDLKVEMTKLQSSQQDAENHVNTTIDAALERLTRFEQRMTNLNFGLSKVEASCNANASHIQEVKSLLSNLQCDITSVTKSALEATEQHDQQSERRDVTEGIETLRQLISEMKDLRDNTQQQIAAELDLVKAARKTALNDIQKMNALPIENQLTWDSSQSLATPKSLKRKRNDSNQESQEAAEECHESNGSERLDAEMKPGDEGLDKARIVNDFVIHRTVEVNVDGVVVPSRKRARKVASTLFQTATAIALGAAATWSALAYT